MEGREITKGIADQARGMEGFQSRLLEPYHIRRARLVLSHFPPPHHLPINCGPLCVSERPPLRFGASMELTPANFLSARANRVNNERDSLDLPHPL